MNEDIFYTCAIIEDICFNNTIITIVYYTIFYVSVNEVYNILLISWWIIIIVINISIIRIIIAFIISFSFSISISIII